jgi:hypothetical protein
VISFRNRDVRGRAKGLAIMPKPSADTVFAGWNILEDVRPVWSRVTHAPFDIGDPMDTDWFGHHR